MVRSPTGSSGVVDVVVTRADVVVVAAGVVVVVSAVGDGTVEELSVEPEVQAVSVRTRKVVRTHIPPNICGAVRYGRKEGTSPCREFKCRGEDR
jgi:hypothetical protein